MPSVKKNDFFETAEGEEIKETLLRMAADTTYNTQATYSANSETYPNNLIPFVDKHVNYMRTHPMTDPQHYMSNLKLMTRIK